MIMLQKLTQIIILIGGQSSCQWLICNQLVRFAKKLADNRDENGKAKYCR